ncbi:putative transposase [Morococcus cerebrosus]|uniref:Putative transposase n=1 Tax=Morococcus cerebrosus TaxID=1056807 RepID=A0A0C1GKM0_9NEIS|nr:putative transposase [Morococcus cerebrosus]
MPRGNGNDTYSGLTLNQYGVASPCRTICTVCGFVALS